MDLSKIKNITFYHNLLIIKQLTYMNHSLLGWVYVGKLCLMLVFWLGLTWELLPAQTSEVDSLKKKLETLAPDSNRFNVLNQLARRHFFVNPRLALTYSEESLQIAQKLKLPFKTALAYQNVGIAYDIQNQHAPALQNALESLKLFEKLNHLTGLASTYNLLGNIYMKYSDEARCVEYYEKALKIRQKLNDVRGQATLYNNLAAVYQKQEKYDKALEYHLKSVQIKEKTKDLQGLGYSYNNIGLIYFDKNELDKALASEEKSLDLFKTSGDKRGEMLAAGVLAKIYFKKNDFAKVIEYGEQAYNLAKSLNTFNIINNIGNELAQSYSHFQEYQKANTILKIYADLRDSSRIKENTQKIERLKYEYELETRGIINQKLLKDKAFQEAENKRLRLEQENLLKDKKLQTLLNQQLALQQTNLLQDKQLNESETAKLRLEQKTLLKDKQLQASELKLKQITIQWQFGIAVFFVIFCIFLAMAAFNYYRNYRLKQKDNYILSEQKEEILKQKEAIDLQNLELAQVNAMKDRLFSVVSHDFRSPLNSVKGVLSLLEMGALSEAEIQFIARDLGEKVNITLAMLDNLLQWARSQMHGIHAYPSAMNIEPLVEDNFNLFKSQAQKKEIALINQIDPALQAFADADMVNIVLRNLLANAIKFSTAGDSITVWAKPQENFIQVCVQDTGQGISPQNLEKLFGKADFSTTGTANEKGTGLGLQLCQDLIEKNNGRIWVESQEGQGSSFYFTLPGLSS
jgi:two-component system, sensor histidine kinase and response regulator